MWNPRKTHWALAQVKGIRTLALVKGIREPHESSFAAVRRRLHIYHIGSKLIESCIAAGQRDRVILKIVLQENGRMKCTPWGGKLIYKLVWMLQELYFNREKCLLYQSVQDPCCSISITRHRFQGNIRKIHFTKQTIHRYDPARRLLLTYRLNSRYIGVCLGQLEYCASVLSIFMVGGVNFSGFPRWFHDLLEREWTTSRLVGWERFAITVILDNLMKLWLRQMASRTETARLHLCIS